MASPAASPSPTPPPIQSPSPHQQQTHSTKPGALVSAAKSLLAEQSARLALKHTTDLDLLDDLRIYLKTRCSIERDYAQALAKLNSNHSKRTSPLLTYVANEDEISDVKTVYTSWKVYQEEMEKHAKCRLTQFEQLANVCDTLKSMRSHKVQLSKKCLDTHLKKMQEEVINSVMEIDKTRKLYFEEEHLAKQARDKEEKIKKRKTGIFSSFTNLQNKKERSSAHREASDIQSTQARNDYIMALAAGNAHLSHYHNQDLVQLMHTIDDAVLDKCRGFVLNLLQTERETVNSWAEVVDKAVEMMEQSSADHTNAVFLRDPNSNSINELILYEFQPCDNDTVECITLEHNADIALRNEGQKWFTWFSKECRNLNRLSAQLVRLQALYSEGHKTVEVSGHGQVDIENRIDDIRQQLRKCEISKIKAKARLQVIRESGAQVQDFENFESQVTTEMKQQSLDVDISIGPLSRTPSVRSTTGLESSKLSSNKADETQPNSSSTMQQQQHQQQPRPESSSSAEQLDSPDREVLQMGSLECSSPAPTSAAYSNVLNSASWDMNYDPTQVAWDDEPPPPSSSATTNAFNGYQDGQNVDDTAESTQTNMSNQIGEDNVTATTTVEKDMTESHEQSVYYEEYTVEIDGFNLVGKQCFALYTYEGQTEDELSFTEQEILSVLEASDKDWVQARNQNGQLGYAPAAYLQMMPEQSSSNFSSDQATAAAAAVAAVSSVDVNNHDATSVAITTTTTTTTSTAYSPTEPKIITSKSVESDAEKPFPEPPTDLATSTAISAGSTTAEGDILASKNANVEYVRAVYDYEATNSEEISFNAGELIRIIDNSSEDGWWTGQNAKGEVGHFSSMLVSTLDDDDEEEESEEEEDEDEENSDQENFPLPPFAALPSVAPPIPPPVLLTDDANSANVATDTDVPSVPAPKFAPPPKPMTLMAPQAVVIIQPTPEIESRPVIGSEPYDEEGENTEVTGSGEPAQSSVESLDNTTEHEQQSSCSTTNTVAGQSRQSQAQSVTNNDVVEKVDDNRSGTNGFKSYDTSDSTTTTTTSSSSVKVALAIAAHEISQNITQQAIDDSMRELSHRASASSIDNHDAGTLRQNATMQQSAAGLPPNQNGVCNDDDNNDQEMLDKDCK